MYQEYTQQVCVYPATILDIFLTRNRSETETDGFQTQAAMLKVIGRLCLQCSKSLNRNSGTSSVIHLSLHYSFRYEQFFHETACT